MSFGTPPSDVYDRLKWLAEQSRYKRNTIEAHRHPDRASSVHLRRIRHDDLRAAEAEAQAINKCDNRLRQLDEKLAGVRAQLEAVEQIREAVLSLPATEFVGRHAADREIALEHLDYGMSRQSVIPNCLHHAATVALGPDYFDSLRPRRLLVEAVEKDEAERSRVVEAIEALEVAVPSSWADPQMPGDPPLVERALA